LIHPPIQRRTLQRIALPLAIITVCALCVYAWRVTSGHPTRTFDAALSLVEQHYFDSDHGALQVAMLRERYRSMAARATSSAQLYSEVLWPMTEVFPHSHLEVTPPEGIAIPAGYSMRSRAPRRGALPPAQLFRAFDGLGGVFIVHDGSAYQVVEVETGSPAALAGVVPGLPASDHEFNQIRSTPSVISEGRIRQRQVDGSEREFAYEFMPAPVFEGSSTVDLDDGIRVLRFDEFTDDDDDEVMQAVLSASPAGLVLDLRRNVGGSIAALRNIAGTLMPPSSVIGHVQSSGDRNILRPAANRSVYQGPVAVLISPRTASAAEILAAALRDGRQAIIVGDRSAGQVLIARRFRLPDGGSLTVPISTFMDARGRALEGAGVTPDWVVHSTKESVEQGRDAVLDSAAAAIRSRRSRRAQ
jgi:C-terminal processing protease CtpA/Prc